MVYYKGVVQMDDNIMLLMNKDRMVFMIFMIIFSAIIGFVATGLNDYVKEKVQDEIVNVINIEMFNE